MLLLLRYQPPPINKKCHFREYLATKRVLGFLGTSDDNFVDFDYWKTGFGT